MSWEGDEPVVRDQDLEEGGDHQEGRGRTHDDRKESFAGNKYDPWPFQQCKIRLQKKVILNKRIIDPIWKKKSLKKVFLLNERSVA